MLKLRLFLSLLLTCVCGIGLQAEEGQQYPDLVFLANGQSMQVMLEALPGEADKVIDIVTPGGGKMSLELGLIAEIRPGLDYRLKNYDQEDLEEQRELARYCMAANRKQDALKILKFVNNKKPLPASQLRSLAQLVDEFEGPKAAIPLYQAYRKLGGKDIAALARLETLEAAIAAHQAKVEEIYAKNPAAKTISEGLEKRTNWRSENTKWAKEVSIKNHPIDMGGNRINTVLQVDYKGGEKDKASIVLASKIDIRVQNLFTFYVSNPSSKNLRMSVAVKCGARWDYFESRTKTVPPQSVWTEISFDLKRNDFKSQASEWKHQDKINEPDNIREIQILIHNDHNDGTIMIDGIGFSKSDKEM